MSKFEMKLLNKLCEINIGKTPARANDRYWNGEHRWLAISDLKSKYIVNTKEGITEKAIKDCNMKLIPKDTVVMSFKLSLGKTAILKEEMYSNEAIASFPIKNSDELIPEYLYYALKTVSLEKYADKAAKGVTLNKKKLNLIEIPYTDIEVQRQIVKTLKIAEKLIESRESQIAALDELTQSIFLEMFGNPRINSFNWDVESLPEIVRKDKYSIKRGPFGGALKKDIFVNDGYLVYEQFHAINDDFSLKRYFITEEKYKELEAFKVQSGDLIVSCSGVTLGRIAEIPKDAKEGIINQALLKISLDPQKMNTTFFKFIFRSKHIQDILFSVSRGSGVPNLPPMPVIKKIPFICPPIELQMKFEQRVNEIENIKLNLKTSKLEMETLYNSLIQKAFKGELFHD